MTVRDYLLALRKSWLVIVALAILGGIAGLGYAQLQPELYSSQASVVIIPARGDNTSELVQGSAYVANLVQTYAVVATSPSVLDPVIEQLGLDMSPQALAGSITVESPLNTVVLQISVVGVDPKLTKAIADAVANQLATAVTNLSPQNADNQSAVRIETITPARSPEVPISPDVRMLVILGVLAGLAAGVVYALLRRALATRLVTHDDVAGITETPILGDVLQMGSGRSLPGAIRADSNGKVAESVRSIVANLRFANVDGKAKVLLVTSGSSAEGKSSVSVSIAQIMAEQGAKVLVVDADLRRASVARLTQLEGSVGLTTVLLGDVTVREAVQAWGESGLDVLTSGVLPPNPGQLLTSDHLRDFVVSVRDSYDIVVFDSAPVLAVSDPLWLAPIVDGIVVVARAKFTKREALLRTIAALETTRVPILGIVFNGVRRAEGTPYYRVEEKGSYFRRPSTAAP